MKGCFFMNFFFEGPFTQICAYGGERVKVKLDD